MKTKIFAICLLVATLLFAAQAQAVGSNAVVNGGFETGDFTGWESTAAFGNAAVVGPYDIGGGTIINPYEGDYMAMLGSPVAGQNWNVFNQIMQAPVTSNYISFHYNFWTYDAGMYDSPAFQFMINGVTVFSMSPETAFPGTAEEGVLNYTGWQFFSLDLGQLGFDPGPEITISFMGGDTGDTMYHSGVFIDDVYAPTPIPGAIWLLGSGLVGLVGLRRKFTS